MIMATNTKVIIKKSNKNHCFECGRELNGKKIKNNGHTVIYCSKCFNLNRQMPIETAIYRDIHGR